MKKFLKGAFRYYTTLYAKFRSETLFASSSNPWSYFNTLNEMDSQFLLVLSACKIDDPEENEKIKIISKHLDRTFTLLRLQRAYDSNDFNEAIYDISKSIREVSAESIPAIFEKKLLDMLSEKRSARATEPFQYAFFKSTSVSDLSSRFIRYFFARVDEFLATEMKQGVRQQIADIVTKTGKKTGFHIEHILAHNDENLEKYEGDEELFEQDRNRLGAVLLLKGRDNQSSNKEAYDDKLKTYANTLYWNETLRRDTYKSKLDFRDLVQRHQLSFKALDYYGPEEVEARQRLLFDLATIIWDAKAEVALADRAA